jgi:hypothetical protein
MTTKKAKAKAKAKADPAFGEEGQLKRAAWLTRFLETGGEGFAEILR